MTFMLFLGMANAYVMRTNMSVAVVAMVNHTACIDKHEEVTNECPEYSVNETVTVQSVSTRREILPLRFISEREKNVRKMRRLKSLLLPIQSSDGEFSWCSKEQGYLLSAFFYGYVITQIPFGILAKRYGSKYFLGIGMLINSLFGLLVPVSAHFGYYWLIVVRFIQGLGEVSDIAVIYHYFSNTT